MSVVETASYVNNLKRAQATNAAGSSYASILPTLTRPVASATRAVFDRGKPGLRTDNTLLVLPLGGNDNNDQVLAKVIGWNQTETGGLWVPEVLAEITATLSATLAGIASAYVVATEFFADTITQTTGGIATLRYGTADVDIASFTVPVNGFEIVELQFKTGTGGDAVNALVRFQ